jgi:hypothetical protein
MVFVPQLIDQMIDRAGRFDLSIHVCVLAEQAQRFPVKHNLDIRKSARARRVKLIGALESQGAGTCQPNLLLLRAEISRLASYSKDIAF